MILYFFCNRELQICGSEDRGGNGTGHRLYRGLHPAGRVFFL